MSRPPTPTIQRRKNNSNKHQTSFLKVKTLKSSSIFSDNSIVTMFIPIATIQSIEYYENNNGENYAQINLIDKSIIQLSGDYDEEKIHKLLDDYNCGIIDLSIYQKEFENIDNISDDEQISTTTLSDELSDTELTDSSFEVYKGVDSIYYNKKDK